ncbi:hypothetical protein V2J09_022510 [Rumex salicifolius]
MEGSSRRKPLLHTCQPLRRTLFNRLFAAVYTCALAAFFYHHTTTLVASRTKLLSLLLLIADVVLAFQWAATQSFRMRPVRRREFLENLETAADFPPALDIFICTADPYKEPPMGVVNTALSVLAYDYPPEKLSVYVSDDGGSLLTLFAFTEAARFASHWIPFCRENKVQARSPEAYFGGTYTPSADTHKIKALYEDMKTRVEDVIEKGKVEDEHILFEQDCVIFNKWNSDFTRQHHPTVIQVLLDKKVHKDRDGHGMPNLIYIRVSASMTNAPIILALDCDMFSNDPRTIWRALCYFQDPTTRPTLGYVQFPQIFCGLNKNDIYASEHKRLFVINPLGMDGFRGPNYVGSNCFFQRRAFFGGPSSPLDPGTRKISPSRIVDKPLQSSDTLDMAHQVASADYEHGTLWGSKMGIRYGSLTEDYFSGYMLQCEGWRGIFCHPERPAFLGDSPTTLVDLLGQCKRWSIGLLEVLFSKFSTLTYGVRSMGLFMGLGYSHYSCWPIYAIPLTIYAFIPQLALLNGISIFPKANDPWVYLYIFLFIGAYAQDLLEFILEKSTFQRWWSSQRIWMICGVSAYLFGCIEYFLSRLGISISSFVVTSKVNENHLNKRYEQGTYEFGVASPMFVPLTMAAIVNIVALGAGVVRTIIRDDHQELALQMLLCGFLVVNSWPVYEAMILRMDKGRLPFQTTMIATLQVLGLCVLGSFFC